MDASRRGFLFGLGAALFADPKMLVGRIPMIWGDGVHDDWEGMQTLFDGKPVKLLSGDTFTPGPSPTLRGGSYLLSRPLKLVDKSHVNLFDMTLTADHDGPVLSMDRCRHVQLSGLHFNAPIEFVERDATAFGFPGKVTSRPI